MSKTGFVSRVQELGDRVEQRWAAECHDLTAFPQIAQSLLVEMELVLPCFDELFAYFSPKSHSSLPLDPENTFGEPSVTLYRTDKFVVDLYYWFSANTSIHSHGFRGAFKILKGPAFEAVFEVPSGQDPRQPVLIAPVALKDMRLLQEGDTVAIEPALDFLHEVGHCQQPQLTLTIRTYNEELIQHNVLLPNVLYVDEKTLEFEDFKTLSLVRAASLAGDQALALNQYERWLTEANPVALLAHHRKPQLLSGDPWLGTRAKALRERNWGDAYLKAEQRDRESRLGYSQLTDPLDRALGFLLQRGVSPWRFEAALVDHFGLEENLNNRIYQLIDSLNHSQGMPKQLNETALHALKLRLNGADVNRVTEVFLQEYEGASESEVRADLLALDDEWTQSSFFRTALEGSRGLASI